MSAAEVDRQQQVRAARAALEEERYDDAENILVELWQKTPEDMDAPGVETLRMLAALQGRTGRYDESLALSLFAARRHRAAGRHAEEAHALATLLTCLASVEDTQLGTPYAVALDRLLADHEETRTRSVRGMRIQYDLMVASASRDAERLHRGVEGLRRIHAEFPEQPGIDWGEAASFFEGLAFQVAGRYAEALARFQQLGSRSHLSAVWSPAQVACGELLALMGRKEEARTLLRDRLQMLSEVAPDDMRLSMALERAREIGKLFRENLGDDEAASEAYELAARLALRRMAQLDRAIRALPELEIREPEDVRLLQRLRTHLGGQHRELLLHLVEALNAAGASTRQRLLHSSDGFEFVLVCAWCQRVRSASGPWLPIGHFVPVESHMHISHGICDGCRSTVVDDLG